MYYDSVYGLRTADPEQIGLDGGLRSANVHVMLRYVML